jgi:3-oxoacyl-[acyl-carrier-protein] synthase-3
MAGIAYHLPERVERNGDLSREHPGWRMDDIQDKTGIFARHVASREETAADLGYLAAKRLLASGLVDPQQIDYLLFCTQSPDYFLPTTACLVQHRLRLGKHVAALDYNLGCSGYVYGLQLADCLVRGGAAKHVLLITADTYTKFIHPGDRTVRTLFGDGAAATLISASSESKIGSFVLGTDGAGAERLIVQSGACRLPRSAETSREVEDESGNIRSQDHLRMDGAAIFAFAISTIPPLVRAVLAKEGLAVENIDWFVFHQANQYMLRQLAVRCGIPSEKMVIELADVGNTVSASIPIALSRWSEAGRIKPGQRLVLIGFGVGYSWGACHLVW